MNSKSPYSQHDEIDKGTEKTPSIRESTNTQAYTVKKNQSRYMKDDHFTSERGRTRSTRDRSPDIDKNSDSYYSDDYDNTTYGSDRSLQPSSRSISPRGKKTDYKTRSITPVRNRGIKKMTSKFPSSKRGPQWGFRSHSLNKESPPKDIDAVTKRVLSARLLKINELRNEVGELQMKLEEFQKENKTLKRLQFRHEKALNKFEDTENEISQLISRHNNEIRTLRERLRKSQERERNTEKRLKDTEEELYRTNVALKKLRQLSENKHLAEREELSKKVDLIESRLDERERKVKELEKNIELTQNSFQRQLLSEKKRAHDAQEENKLLQEKIQRLTQKVKDKERELDAKNIYAYRLSKPSPKRETEVTPRKKGTTPTISTGIQTNEHDSWLNFSPPPPPPLFVTEENLESQQVLGMEKDNLAKQLKEESENRKKEKEMEERKQDQEEKLIRDREQKILEDKARKLHEDWEKAEIERQKKDLFHQDLLVQEANVNKSEERLKKELLLTKMFEIDRENQEPVYSESSKPLSPIPPVDALYKMNTAETKHKTYTFSEPTQKLFNGLPVQGGRDLKRSVYSPISENNMDTNVDFTFGSYTPSFGRGKSTVQSQKKDVLDEPVITKLDIQKEKKNYLMEQLFGHNLSTTLPSISKVNDQTGLTSSSSRTIDSNSNNILPWEQNCKQKDNAFFSGDGKIVSSSRHRMQQMPGRTVIKVVDSVEDEIEEVAL